MSINTRSNRVAISKERVKTACRLRANDHTKVEMANNSIRVVELKAQGKCCQNCAARIQVKFTSKCRAQRMKMVKEQNICHL